MHDERERVTRLLDDVAAGRDPRDYTDLSAVERHLAETAVLLTAAQVYEPGQGIQSLAVKGGIFLLTHLIACLFLILSRYPREAHYA